MNPYRRVLRSKIHRATITHADLHYEGSITIPPELMQLAGLIDYEAVHVWNVTRGSRVETYAITGTPGSGTICINGAAAHLFKPGDLVIIACFMHVLESELAEFEPKVIFVDSHNRKVDKRLEMPGPLMV